MFSPHDEIREYLDHCVEKYQLSKYIELSHRVIGATWNEAAQLWEVQIEDTANQIVFSDQCHFLINAGGILNNWRWPSIPGLHDFGGKLVHSANWPSDWDYKGLKVAVVGNGSTGIQIVPSLQPHVKELVHIIRSPTWVTPGAASRYPSLIGGEIPERYGEEQKARFRSDPASYLAFRKQVEREINSKFRMLVNGSDRAEEARRKAHESMVQLLGPEGASFADKVIPDFPVGCRRITPGVGYLESFTEPNVRVVTDASIEKAEEDGLLMSNAEHLQLDAIVCATGFDVSFNPRFPIIGRDEVSLQDVWSKPNMPYAYLSMAVPKFPNYFSEFQAFCVLFIGILTCPQSSSAPMPPSHTAASSPSRSNAPNTCCNSSPRHRPKASPRTTSSKKPATTSSHTSNTSCRGPPGPPDAGRGSRTAPWMGQCSPSTREAVFTGSMRWNDPSLRILIILTRRAIGFSTWGMGFQPGRWRAVTIRGFWSIQRRRFCTIDDT